jgi:hypothetical protein
MTSRYYSLVRFVPDIVRGEAFNVAVAVADGGRLVVRGLTAPTRLLVVGMPSSDVHFCLEVPGLIENAYEIWSAPDATTMRDPATFLMHLSAEGLSGLLFDGPYERLAEGDASADADALFLRLVAAQRLIHLRSERRKTRARTLVHDLIAREGFPASIVPRKVTVALPERNYSYDFDFACANGRVSFGQSVDLDVSTPNAQEKNALGAMINAAEIGRVFELSRVNVVSVVKTSEDVAVEDQYLRRIETWGSMYLLPKQQDAFLRYLERSAEHDVADVVRGLGHRVVTSDGGIEIFVEDPAQPLGVASL